LDAFGTLQLAVVSTSTVSAPEPGTIWVIGAAFIGLIRWQRRQKKVVSARALIVTVYGDKLA
jgi:hypothetical protein